MIWINAATTVAASTIATGATCGRLQFLSLIVSPAAYYGLFSDSIRVFISIAEELQQLVIAGF